MVAALILSMVQGSAEPGIVWHITQKGWAVAAHRTSVALPRQTVVKRGRTVRITGFIKEGFWMTTEKIKGYAYIFLDGATIASIPAVEGEWHYDWDTTDARFDRMTLSVGYRRYPTTKEFKVGTCEVTLIKDEPATMTIEPREDGGAMAAFTVAPDLKIREPVIVVDGQTADTLLGSDNRALVRRAFFNSPFETINIQCTAVATYKGKPAGSITIPRLTATGRQALSLDRDKVRITDPDDAFDARIELPLTDPAGLKPNTIRAFIGGEEVRGEPNDTGFFLNVIDIPRFYDRDFWMTAVNSKGERVYSARTTLDKIGLRDMKIALDKKLESEVARVRALLPNLSLGNDPKSSKPVTEMLKDPRRDKIVRNGPAFDPGQGIPELKGVTLRTMRMVPEYSDLTPEGDLEIGEKFARYWEKEDFDYSMARKSFEATTGTPEWEQTYAKLGKHHQKLLDTIVTQTSLFFDKMQAVEEARVKAVQTKDYKEVTRCTMYLNDSEAIRLSACRALHVIEDNLRLPIQNVLITRWYQRPFFPDDVVQEKTLLYPAFQWWLRDPTLDMFP